jgi:oligopeptide/dipeptide ABC transporter ATP-binding protein
MVAETNESMVAGSSTGNVLDVRDLSVRFPIAEGPDVFAVRDFNLAVKPGEFVGLMGEPGCGKSTAAMAFLGLVRPPGVIDSGQINFVGDDILKMDEETARQMRGRDIGMIVQNPRYSLHPMMRVGDQIANVYRAHNDVGKREAWNHAVDMLRMVGINDPERRVKAYAHELSSGMAQRVLIAIALSSQPKLLIADEPTSGLDVTIQAQFLDQMWDSCRQTNAAVVLVTQDLGIVANYCDRVVIVHEGTIVEDSDVYTFFESPQHEYSRRILKLQREAQAAGESVLGKIDRDAAPIVEVKDMSKLFPIRASESKVHAAEHVDFELRPGECLGLVGESGSGKTTIGRCVLRLVEPTQGEIVFQNRNIAEIRPNEFRKFRGDLQIVFQDPLDSLNPRWTVHQVLSEPLKLHTNLSNEEKESRISELLALVGLEPSMRFALPREMSAGRQQRASIARAIASNPDFIVLDEPTSALTPETTAEIIQLLMDLSSKLGIAYLFISHDLTTVKYICHRVVVLYLGQIVEVGTKDQVFNDPQHPYSKALLSSHLFPDTTNRRVEREVRETLEGEIPSPITENLPKGCYLYGRCPSQVDKCRDLPQELTKLDDGRSVRCWRVAEGELPSEPAAH